MRSKKQPEIEAKRVTHGTGPVRGAPSPGSYALPLWSGTADQLETLRVPLNASVGEFAERFVRHQARSQQLTEERRSIAAEVENCSRALSQSGAPAVDTNGI